MPASDCLLIVFAKPPLAGISKTRLIPALGASGAARLQHVLLVHTLQTLPDSAGWTTRLCVTECHPLVDSLCFDSGVEQTLQQGNDLGQRMFNAMQEAHQHYARVIIVGTDCPFLGKHDIKAAFEALASGGDFVFAPALDGGYVLVGSTLDTEAMFSAIEWGSDAVMQQTLQQADRNNIRVTLLDAKRDIDRPQDLAALSELESFQAFAREWPSPPGLR